MSAVPSSPAVGRRLAPRSRLQRMLNSSIGLKLVMALTGVILSGFVLGHMLGNLQVFQGAEAIDAYGKLLRKEPALLWAARLGAARRGRPAHLGLPRPDAEEPEGPARRAIRARKYRESSFASRSMTLTGPLLLAFIIYHILHLTTGTVHPELRGGARLP